MPTKNLIDAEAYLDNKIAWILSTYLGGVVAAYNTANSLTGPEAIPVPLKTFVGVDAVPFESAGGNVFDTFPALVVRASASTPTEDDVVSTRDLKVTYDILATVASDVGDVDYSSRQAKQLAIAAEQVLEAHLPDNSQDTTGCVCYNTNLVSVSAANILPLQANRIALVTFGVQLEASIRVNYQYDPKSIVDGMPNKPWLPSKYEPTTSTVATDLAVALGTVTPNTDSPLSITAGDLGAATSIDYTTNNPDTSIVYVVQQNTLSRTQVAVAGGVASVPLGTIGVSDGAEHTVTIINSDTGTPTSYRIIWTVTP